MRTNIVFGVHNEEYKQQTMTFAVKWREWLLGSESQRQMQFVVVINDGVRKRSFYLYLPSARPH
jgi:hypothetical protein